MILTVCHDSAAAAEDSTVKNSVQTVDAVKDLLVSESSVRLISSSVLNFFS